MYLQDNWLAALGCFTIAAVFGMYGQIAVVDDASSGEPPGKKARTLRVMALA